MGDRTWVQIIVRKEDQAVAEQFLDEANEETHAEDGSVLLFWGEYNHAAYDELAALAEDGIVFNGEHGSGDNYPAMTFATSKNKIVHYWQEISIGIEWGEDGEPFLSKSAIENLKTEKAAQDYAIDYFSKLQPPTEGG